MAYFLLEIGTEEIPDWMIESALEDLRARYQAAFAEFGGSGIIVEGTPRRLVLLAKNILDRAPDVQAVISGPYVSAGAKAAEGFARKQGTTVDQLARVSEAKGERYVFHQLTKGQTAHEALSEKLPEVITGVHFPKTMYWTGKNGVRDGIGKNYPCRKRWKVCAQFRALSLKIGVLLKIIMEAQHKLVIRRAVVPRDSGNMLNGSDKLTERTRRHRGALSDFFKTCIH